MSKITYIKPKTITDNEQPIVDISGEIVNKDLDELAFEPEPVEDDRDFGNDVFGYEQ